MPPCVASGVNCEDLFIMCYDICSVAKLIAYSGAPVDTLRRTHEQRAAPIGRRRSHQAGRDDSPTGNRDRRRAVGAKNVGVVVVSRERRPRRRIRAAHGGVRARCESLRNPGVATHRRHRVRHRLHHCDCRAIRAVHRTHHARDFTALVRTHHGVASRAALVDCVRRQHRGADGFAAVGALWASVWGSSSRRTWHA